MLGLLVTSLLMFSSAGAGWFSNCGKLSASCTSTNPVNTEEYLGLSAAEKKARIMEKVMEDTNSADWLTSLQVAGIFTERMCPTFLEKGDQMPWEKKLVFYGHRQKYIHSVGVVGTGEWRSVGDHGYTGVFTGSQNVIMRMSLASQPDPDKLKTTPGIALKFLRDGLESGNMVAMFSVDGQQSWNFFRNNITNHIPPLDSLALAPLGTKFATATRNIGQVGLSDMARFAESGSESSPPVFPFSLNFVPTGEISFPDEYVQSFTADLMTIPSGSTLYKVYALDKPVELGGTETHIADLVLSTSLTTSKWGDQHLFFRHQTVEDDTSLQQTWGQYLDQWDLGIQTCPSLSLL